MVHCNTSSLRFLWTMFFFYAVIWPFPSPREIPISCKKYHSSFYEIRYSQLLFQLLTWLKLLDLRSLYFTNDFLMVVLTKENVICLMNYSREWMLIVIRWNLRSRHPPKRFWSLSFSWTNTYLLSPKIKRAVFPQRNKIVIVHKTHSYE